MADVRPLRGVRFNPRQSGPIGPLLAPPYDVASTPGANAEFNISRIEGVRLDGEEDDHLLASRRYRLWREEGVLVRDAEPSIYLHVHQFQRNGSPVTRTGILARVRLHDWSERIVLPHEETNPGPRHERLERLRAVQANLSPLYFLYRDMDGVIRDMAAEQLASRPDLTSGDRMGGTHRLVSIVDRTFHEEIARRFASQTLFVADGHHRYEAALEYRNECRRQQNPATTAASGYVLALLAAVEDAGVIVEPTHRILDARQNSSPDSMLGHARAWFDVQVATAAMPRHSETFVARLVLPEHSGTWDLFSLPGAPHLQEISSDRGSAWRSLPIVAVEALTRQFSSAPESLASQLLPMVDAREATLQVAQGSAGAAFLLPNPGVNRLLAVAEQGDLLPPKSTWFHPKAPAGLVINSLRDE